MRRIGLIGRIGTIVKFRIAATLKMPINEGQIRVKDLCERLPELHGKYGIYGKYGKNDGLHLQAVSVINNEVSGCWEKC